eukprot:1493250-Pyramimonas_sp.AAC.1
MSDHIYCCCTGGVLLFLVLGPVNRPRGPIQGAGASTRVSFRGTGGFELCQVSILDFVHCPRGPIQGAGTSARVWFSSARCTEVPRRSET